MHLLAIVPLLRSRCLAVVALSLLIAPAAVAQPPAQGPAPEGTGGEPVDLFGFRVAQSERFAIGGEFVAGWSHDAAQAALGFEKQGRVGMAILSVRGQVSNRVRYFLSINPVSETTSKPACGEKHHFYPNDPSLYAGAGPAVPCDVEDGLKRVDTYNTYSLDYVVQQGILREGYVDWVPSPSVSFRGGRFILPVGFAPREIGAAAAKDMTRIQRLNAEANFGAMLAYSSKRASGAPVLDVAAMAVLGDGTQEKDYDWFYFVNRSLDSNSDLTFVVSARARPHRSIDLRAAYKKGSTGSKVERLPTYWASKRHDDALVLSLKVAPAAWASVFGEYARYKWGPTASSAELLGLAGLAPIVKAGYYAGATLEAPLSDRIRVGTTVTTEEISRDDSLIQYLALHDRYGVSMGKKDRAIVTRVYLDVSRLVNVSIFWADISNPFPWASGSWPVSGPTAYSGRPPNRYGVTLSVRTP